MLFKVIFLAAIGGLIGWTTNVLAIKMLFRPLQPYKLPLLGIEIQGVIPKRRKEMARSIAETVEKELISIPAIVEQFATEEKKMEIMIDLKYKIMAVIEKKMPPFIPVMFRGMIVDFVEEQINAEGYSMLEEAIAGMSQDIEKEISLSQMMEEKINEFELEKIEEIILSIAKNELKHIELLGGVLGVLIGLVQGLVVLFL